MKKMITLALTMMLALNAFPTAAETEENWAYAALPLNNEGYGIGIIYFVRDYFTTSRVNPLTVAPYTEEEIAAIRAGAKQGEGYVLDVPAGAVCGLSVYGRQTIYWFDAENTAAIVSHADALNMNSADGAVKAADGTLIAAALARTSAWAYAAMTLNSEAANVGTIYFAGSYFSGEHVNPLTAQPFTAEEIAAVMQGKENGAGYVEDLPEGAVIGMNACDGGEVFWFDADSAAQIVSHADPLALNAATGELYAADGTRIAKAL